MCGSYANPTKHGVDGRWVWSFYVECWELRRGEDEVVVFVEEDLESLPDLAVELLGVRGG